MPLNITQEIFQQSRNLKVIHKKLPKALWVLQADKDRKNYKKFYEAYSFSNSNNQGVFLSGCSTTFPSLEIKWHLFQNMSPTWRRYRNPCITSLVRAKNRMPSLSFCSQLLTWGFEIVYMMELNDVAAYRIWWGESHLSTKKMLEIPTDVKKMEESKTKSDNLCQLIKEILERRWL